MAEQYNDSKKTDEWKQKYLALVESNEKQTDYQSLVERALSRLALAATGIDPTLDQHLSSIRKLINTTHTDHNAFANILKKLEKTISALEDKKVQPSKVIESLTQLIEDVEWPDKQQKNAKKLLKSCLSSTDDDLDDIFNQLLKLISKSFNEVNKQRGGGLFGKFFNGSADASSKVEVQQEAHTESDHVTTPQKHDITPPDQVLITLLEKISLPDTLGKKSTALRRTIAQGLSQENLPKTLDNIAELISELSNSVSKEKREYETFLKDLTEKIASLDQYLSKLAKDDASAFKQKRQLTEQVEQEMEGIKSDVEIASDLAQLKTTLNKRIDNLNLHIHTYYQTDLDRFKQSQQQVEQLTERLQQLESETETLRVANNQARELALKDALTGIWNRQALNEMMEREFNRWQRYGNPLTLVVWDVDFFKKVNDEFGHSAGDVVLKTIAHIFDKATRKSDFIARFGGEEFVGLFPETSLSDGLNISNKIRESIKKTPFKYKDTLVPITASAGLATFEKGDDIESVFSRADAALYKAKESGRDNCQIAKK